MSFKIPETIGVNALWTSAVLNLPSATLVRLVRLKMSLST
jgi:hypothetical protein